MANMLRGSARTTPRIRAELQKSKEKTSVLAQRYGLSRTTVTKWRLPTATAHAPMGPTKHKSTVLLPAEQAAVVQFRRKGLLLLDAKMAAFVKASPRSAAQPLSRSSLHRWLQRHGISRLPASEMKTTGKGKFAPTEIGHAHIDIAELRLAECKLNVFLAIDRVSKFTYARLRDDMGKTDGANPLRGVTKALPC